MVQYRREVKGVITMDNQDWQWVISLAVTIWIGYKTYNPPIQNKKPTKRRRPKRKR